jgi:hypothetical protein
MYSLVIDFIQATEQSLVAATSYSSGLEHDSFPADGLLGMGHESLLSFGDSTVFQTLVTQGQVSDPVFSFYLAGSGSELYIGGTNQNHYKGSFTYVPVSVLVSIHGDVTGPEFTVHQYIAGFLASLLRPYFCQRKDCRWYQGSHH